MRAMRYVAMLTVLLFVTSCGGSPTAPSRPATLWTSSGTGNTVLDMPTYVQRVTITGKFSGNSSNFIIWIGQNLIVNELLGTLWGPTTYTGTHVTNGGGVVRIENSSQVAWTFTEVR